MKPFRLPHSIRQCCVSRLPVIMIFAHLYGACAGSTRDKLAPSVYANAVLACQDQLRVHPDDKVIQARCGEVRRRFVAQHLDTLESLRQARTDLAALVEIDSLLRFREGWGSPLEPALAERLDVDLKATAVAIRKAVDQLRDKPLAAESYLAERLPFMSRFPLHALREDLLARNKADGERSCERLRQTVTSTTPYWGCFIERYCAHFGRTEATQVDRPSGGKIKITTNVSGMTQEQTNLLSREIAQRFHNSVWARALTTENIRVTVAGQYVAHLSEATVTLYAPYTDYNVSVPIPLTGDSSIMLNRDHKQFAYNADESRGRYELALMTRVDFGPAVRPLGLPYKRSESLRAYDHDVTFDLAHVSPVHQRIPTEDTWLAAELASLGEQFELEIQRRWIQSSCEEPSMSPEDAARCVYANDSPATADRVLAAALGDDPSALIRLSAERLTPPHHRTAAPRQLPVRSEEREEPAR